jgi:hypothetical protein
MHIFYACLMKEGENLARSVGIIQRRGAPAHIYTYFAGPSVGGGLLQGAARYLATLMDLLFILLSKNILFSLPVAISDLP